MNLSVEADGVTGTPLSSDGFAFVWAGVRAMFGVQKGKIAYEVKVIFTCSGVIVNLLKLFIYFCVLSKS